jgi:hypothetical protein
LADISFIITGNSQSENFSAEMEFHKIGPWPESLVQAWHDGNASTGLQLKVVLSGQF